MLLVILLQSALATAGSADIDNAFNDMLGASSKERTLSAFLVSTVMMTVTDRARKAEASQHDVAACCSAWYGRLNS